MKKRLDIHEGIILFGIIFILLGIFVPGKGMSDFMIALLSVSSFLFGIFMAFSIADRHQRLKDIRGLLRRGDASITHMYNLCAVFGKKKQKEFQTLLDRWIIAQLDYYLRDYKRSEPEFFKLYDFLIKLKPKTGVQNEGYETISDSLKELNTRNKVIRYLSRDRMSNAEWGSILLLGGIILFSLFYINANTFGSIALIVLLGIALVILILLLRDLDALYWKEQHWVWDPITDLFRQIDLLPYFPDEVIDRQRIKIKKGLKYRVAHYPHPYPDTSGKTIEIKKS